MNFSFLINMTYILSAVLFALGLKMLSSPASARKGNLISAVGMLMAVIATLVTKGMTFQWIIAGFVLGGIVGALAARLVAMTAMPCSITLGSEY